MIVKILAGGKLEITMPNGTALLFVNQVLRGAVAGSNLYTNFNDGERNAPRIRRALSTWAAMYEVGGGGERSEAELTEIYMKPVAVDYGDYTRGQKKGAK